MEVKRYSPIYYTELAFDFFFIAFAPFFYNCRIRVPTGLPPPEIHRNPYPLYTELTAALPFFADLLSALHFYTDYLYFCIE